MIIKDFDYQVAQYNSLDEVKLEELEQASLVRIRGYVPQGIYHSEFINWKGDLSAIQNAEDFLRSKKEKKHLATNRQYFLDKGYTFAIQQIDEPFLDIFIKLYEETTLQRNRALDYNARIAILKNIRSGLPVYVFGMFKDEKIVSGLLATSYKDEMKVMFGAKKKFPEVRGGVGGILEIDLLRFCLENHILKVSHGTSTNPSGIYEQAGVFEFKARYGFSAFPYGAWYTSFILKNDVPISDLVFISVQDNQLCQMVLTTSSEDLSNKYKTKEVPVVKQFLLETEIQKAREYFNLK